MDVVIIPAYQPDERLPALARALHAHGLGLLIVDDGSGEAYGDIFAQTEPWARVLHLPENHGKGAALRTGIAAVRELFPHCSHFITADSDGQHSPADILRMLDPPYRRSTILLTERDLREEIPPLSKIGNVLSRWVFTLLTGRYYRDNQSGLRRFSVRQADWLLQVGGDKYDYEMNTLFCAQKRGLRVDTMPIQTIYLDGNSASHFRPLEDTLAIYRRLFTTALPSVTAALLAQLAMLALSLTLGSRLLWATVPLVGIVSALTGVLGYRILVFGKYYRSLGADVLRVLLRYAVHTLLLALLTGPLPLFLAYQITSLFLLPVRYHFWKLLRLQKRP